LHPQYRAASAGLALMGDAEKGMRRVRESEGEDRRKGLRFSIQRKVRYSTANGKQGTGTSVDISRNGILFITQQALDVGEFVKISLEWPVRRDQKTPLKLVLRGQVVRCSNDRAAVFVKQHELRTLDLREYSRGSSSRATITERQPR
jgi:PilZ domain